MLLAKDTVASEVKNDASKKTAEVKETVQEKTKQAKQKAGEVAEDG